MKTTVTIFALLLLATAALSQTSDGAFFNDGEPEVILGAYFDIAGTDTLMTLKADTLSVYLVMWNASLRDEGEVVALEYQIQIPDGLRLVKDELPLYSHLCLGTVEAGFSQTLEKRHGDGLLVNTLRLYRDGDVADDARIRVLPHPDTEKLQWVAMPGGPKSVTIYLMHGQDAIVNPKLTTALEGWKPVKSR